MLTIIELGFLIVIVTYVWYRGRISKISSQSVCSGLERPVDLGAWLGATSTEDDDETLDLAIPPPNTVKSNPNDHLPEPKHDVPSHPGTSSLQTLNSNGPLRSFRKNLLKDKHYVTFLPHSGVPNQLLVVWKIVHLAQLLDRVAILAGSNPPFSEFYDLDRFVQSTNIAILEWAEIKLPHHSGGLKEKLSCWGQEARNRDIAGYDIDVTYWPAPKDLFMTTRAGQVLNFAALQVLATRNHSEWLDQIAQESWGGVDEPPFRPDNQVFCIDDMYSVYPVHFMDSKLDAVQTIESLTSHDPVWDMVGKHFHFNNDVDIITYQLLQSTFEAKLGTEFDTPPPFIGVHVRRKDLVTGGGLNKITIQRYVEAVKEVRQDLENHTRWSNAVREGGLGLAVLFTTDSNEKGGLGSTEAPGMVEGRPRQVPDRADESCFDPDSWHAVERFGGWYCSILDSSILSRGVGFVGTEGSTFSYLTARRVETWSGGVTRFVTTEPTEEKDGKKRQHPRIHDKVLS
ncbi:BQ2448_371 [Microbotryum intermedium]|uniref:BQ2448_371 protein n=1 Tax=Microbotryum intermedium TaxID=269621 RepID=A0A238F294_9BASI|nr:BQ2448_371 [Microbotryum intermedium]